MTKKRAFFIVFAMIVTVAIAATDNDSAAKELLKVEEDRYRAMEKVDQKHLDAVMDDSLIFIHASGRKDTKNSFLTRLGKGLTYNKITTKDMEARVYGACGVVTGKSDLDLTAGERKLTLHLIFTSVYAKIDGKWVIVSYQSTREPE
ncbi:nuclear transport factor 2 family protein [Candidatus Latescibacterota bacterium]